ncbi:hypothetical protein QBC44DRAFT_102834 [Cladorrhinum sp. PSN332]|nr:hypothetical protein QBC44DRAFT_102834 [Cladorrhinum sp. PSN332]
MPFFSRSSEPAHQPAPQPIHEEPPKRHGLFGRHRSPSPATTTSTRSTRTTSAERGQNGVYRSSTDATNSTGRRSLLRSFGNGNNVEMDPSIVAARERVMGAEMAEREADRALMAARESVREAREHVRRLELEAQEEARRATIKQQQAKEMSKRGKQLGRYDY